MAFHRTSKSGLFLLEMIFVILFFSLTSAICVRLFAQAHLTSSQSSQLNQAMLQAQSAAEIFKSRTTDLDAVADLLQGETDGSTVTVGYGVNWQVCQPKEARFRLTVALQPLEPGKPLTAQIEVTDLQRREKLFQLTAGRAVFPSSEEVGQ